MENREAGLEILEQRLSPIFQEYPLRYFKRNPARTVVYEDMPCLLILELDDNIIKKSNRNNSNYPLIRNLEIAVEVWDLESGNVKDLRKRVIEKSLQQGAILTQNVSIEETKTIGPFNLGVAQTLGMRVVFTMTYIDNSLG